MVTYKLSGLLLLLALHSAVDAQNYQYQRIDKFNRSSIIEFWQQLDDIFNDPNFNNANWGVCIKSLETGEFFYRRNDTKLFIPASNLKLFTTSGALLSLGPNYRFKTKIYLNGIVDGSILDGDLIIRGFGDPTISGRFSDGDIFKVFNEWADTLIAMGIDEITGNIIGDDNSFESKGLGTGWAWDYESYWYSASTSAISFNDNCVDISVKPSSTGNPAVISVLPDTKYVTIINKVETTNSFPGLIDVYRERGTNIITVFGKINAGSDEKKIFATVNNPTQFSMVVLKSILQKKGIYVRGYAADVDEEPGTLDYNTLKEAFTHYSPPLSEIIKITNKDSHNFYAEQILRTIGYEKFNYGSVENGVKEIKELLASMGINSENMIIADGSGLSRLNLITPKQINDLLSYIYKSDIYPFFFQSLSVAGVDGSIASRMRKTKAENNVRAKAGYLEGVRSLSGYVNTADNEPVAFSIIVNNFIVPASIADNIQDLVCLRLANFSRK